MNPRERRIEALKKELKRRKSLPNLLEICFKQQQEFISSKSTRKALFVARRSGKSFAIAVYLLAAALKNPRVKVLYVGLTKATAENVMWTHAIEQICREYNIPHTFNKVTKSVLFSNGSIIKLTGADVSESEMERFLGGKYFLVAVDECQSFRQDLRELINEKLAPAVSDYASIPGGGTIVLAGTPSNRMGDHYWYQVTKTEGQREPGWEVHHWECLDNPHMKNDILVTWEDMRVREGDTYQDSDTFKQQWLCQWVVDNTAKAYRFDPLKNILLEKIPLDERYPTEARKLQLQAELKIVRSLQAVEAHWFYILGVDLGVVDDNAWVVGAFNKNDYNFYIVESFCQNNITTQTNAEIIRELHDKYKFRSMVVDAGGLGKQIALDLNRVYGIPIKAADKTGEKEASIFRMNSDMQTGNVKVIQSNNKELIVEWNTLLVDRKKQSLGIFKEADRYKNHLADAALYAYREARHYRSTPKESPINDMASRLIAQRTRTKPIFPSWHDEMKEEQENRAIVDKYREDKTDTNINTNPYKHRK